MWMPQSFRRHRCHFHLNSWSCASIGDKSCWFTLVVITAAAATTRRRGGIFGIFHLPSIFYWQSWARQASIFEAFSFVYSLQSWARQLSMYWDGLTGAVVTDGGRFAFVGAHSGWRIRCRYCRWLVLLIVLEDPLVSSLMLLLQFMVAHQAKRSYHKGSARVA